MKKPKVSIIVAVYNVEEFLRDCLNSISKQNYTDWEAIVVDDGSTDNSLSVCKDFARNDNRFKIISTENGGSSNARNHGLQAATGEYIIMVDGDDMLTSDAVGESVRCIEKYGVDIVTSECILISESGLPMPHRVNIQSQILSAIDFLILMNKGKLRPSIWCKIYRKNIIGDIRFNLKLRMAQDVYFNNELLLNNLHAKVYIDKFETYYYRIRQNSVSRTNPDSKLLPYLSETFALINNKVIGCSVELTHAMVTNLVGTYLNYIYRQPAFRKRVDSFGKKMISDLYEYITTDNQKSAAKVILNQSPVAQNIYFSLDSIYQSANRILRKLIRHIQKL